MKVIPVYSSLKRHKVDRRYYIIHLTTQGNKLIKSIFPRHAGKIVTEMAVLNAGEQKKLSKLCKKLGLKNKL